MRLQQSCSRLSPLPSPRSGRVPVAAIEYAERGVEIAAHELDYQDVSRLHLQPVVVDVAARGVDRREPVNILCRERQVNLFCCRDRVVRLEHVLEPRVARTTELLVTIRVVERAELLEGRVWSFMLIVLR